MVTARASSPFAATNRWLIGAIILYAIVITFAISLALGLSSGAAQTQASSAAHPSFDSHSGVASALCGSAYYKNVNGVCVHRPSTNPRGATARCRDGTYSYSRHAAHIMVAWRAGFAILDFDDVIGNPCFTPGTA